MGAVGAVSKLTGLTSLTLRTWTNSRVTPTGLRALSNLTALTFLDLAPLSNVTDKGVQALNNLTSLTSLNLEVRGEDKLTDNGMQRLSSLNVRRTSLVLQDCFKVTDNGLRALSSLTSLKLLVVINCNKVTREGMLSSIRRKRFRH